MGVLKWRSHALCLPFLGATRAAVLSVDHARARAGAGDLPRAAAMMQVGNDGVWTTAGAGVEVGRGGDRWSGYILLMD